MERFGKPNAPLLDARGHLLTLEGNEPLVERTRQLYAVYRQQPRRHACKICASSLPDAPMFRKFDIPYFACRTCGHVNGGFEDTAAFNAFLFTGEGSQGTVAHYSESSRSAFDSRVTDIYQPKAQFLFDALAEAGEDPARLAYADLGAGTGHFVAALERSGMTQSIGYDVSAEQVALGNRLLGADRLFTHAMDALETLAAHLVADVVSLVFTLEHLEHPRALLAALRGNPRLRYILIAVPTVSAAMILEMVFPSVFERQMSTHTHLFTDASLRWLAEAEGFERIAAWWFGSDVMDLHRAVAVRLRQTGQSEEGVALWTDMMEPLIDAWQITLDRTRQGSAVHLVLRKRGDQP